MGRQGGGLQKLDHQRQCHIKKYKRAYRDTVMGYQPQK